MEGGADRALKVMSEVLRIKVERLESGCQYDYMSANALSWGRPKHCTKAAFRPRANGKGAVPQIDVHTAH